MNTYSTLRNLVERVLSKDYRAESSDGSDDRETHPVVGKGRCSGKSRKVVLSGQRESASARRHSILVPLERHASTFPNRLLLV
jgi:hypothetical protein